MKTEQRQNPQRFVPVPGEVYENAGGGRFECTDRDPSTTAQMTNIASGWTCIAHNIVRYEDGTIEWDYSTGGHFEWRQEVRQRQRSMMNALLCCMI